MYKLTEEQLNTLVYIINSLTVTGPRQGGMLNNAAGILDAVRQQNLDERGIIKP